MHIDLYVYVIIMMVASGLHMIPFPCLELGYYTQIHNLFIEDLFVSWNW